MNEVNLLQSLGQVSASETGQVFRDFLCGHVREMICEVMAAEVTELCGRKHAPSGSTHYRAGTSPGRVLYEGEREKVVRPRVRCKSDDGTSQEVDLASYRVAKDPEQLRSQIVQAIVSGVSTRGVEAIKPDSPGVKRSNVSRLWQEAGRASVQGVAEHLEIPVWPAGQVKSSEFAEQVRLEAVDLILNVHSLHIVHPEVLAAARVGAFNLHTGPLPSYAGMNAVNWAIMNGESQHGTTLHWMEHGIDTGDIAFETTFDLSPQATGLSVNRQCTNDGIDLIRQLLRTDPDSIPRRSQDFSQRHYY